MKIISRFKSKNNINLDTKLTDKNTHDYLIMISKLYNKGEYSKALKGFKKLSELSKDSRIYFVPYIEKCQNVLKKPMSEEDINHQRNQYIMKHFTWAANLKFITGFIAVICFFTYSIIGIVLAIILGWFTYFIHKRTSKFTYSLGLVRCKYCGHYTEYIDPNEPTFGFANTNNCEHCGRMYPMPTTYWDSWSGLIYMEERHSVPDPEFYDEFNELKNKYRKEYKKFIKESKE